MAKKHGMQSANLETGVVSLFEMQKRRLRDMERGEETKNSRLVDPESNWSVPRIAYGLETGCALGHASTPRETQPGSRPKGVGETSRTGSQPMQTCWGGEKGRIHEGYYHGQAGETCSLWQNDVEKSVQGKRGLYECEGETRALSHQKKREIN